MLQKAFGTFRTPSPCWSSGIVGNTPLAPPCSGSPTRTGSAPHPGLATAPGLDPRRTLDRLRLGNNPLQKVRIRSFPKVTHAGNPQNPASPLDSNRFHHFVCPQSGMGPLLESRAWAILPCLPPQPHPQSDTRCPTHLTLAGLPSCLIFK